MIVGGAAESACSLCDCGRIAMGMMICKMLRRDLVQAPIVVLNGINFFVCMFVNEHFFRVQVSLMFVCLSVNVSFMCKFS